MRKSISAKPCGRFLFACGAIIVVLLFATCSARGPAVSFVTAVPWGIAGKTLILDTHTHTRFSDGAFALGDVVSKAVASGCSALAITDHTDASLHAATPEYFEAIDAARAKFPDLVLFAGVEWNIPPYGGREHVTVLLDSSRE